MTIFSLRSVLSYVSWTNRYIPWSDQLIRALAAIPEVVLEILGGIEFGANEESGLAGDLITNAELEDGTFRSSGMVRDLLSADS